MSFCRSDLHGSLFAWAVAASLVSGATAGDYAVQSSSDIREAMRKARPGDTLVMRDGVWRDADIVFTGEGAPGRPITLKAETPSKVILSGASHLRLSGQHLVVEGLWFKGGNAGAEEVIEFRTSSSKQASNCRVTQCAIVDYNPPAKKPESKWVSLYGVSNRVDHCYFAGKTNEGTLLVVWVEGQPNHHRIDHNHFGPRPRLGVNGGETIRVGDSAHSLLNSRTVVEDNLFDRCNGEVEIVSSKSCENVYRRNTFSRCEGALTLRHGNRCVVEANFFLGHGERHTGGVRVIGEGHRVINNYFAGLRGDGSRAALSVMNGIPDSPLHKYFQVKDAVVAFNTFVNCEETIVVGLRGESKATLPPVNVTFANNILAGKKEPLVSLLEKAASLQWQGNLFHGAATGLAAMGGVRVADPLLARGHGQAGLMRPGSESPALGAGEGAFTGITEDIDGQPRGDRKDIGCDQRSDKPVLLLPQSSKTTGPGWLYRTAE